MSDRRFNMTVGPDHDELQGSELAVNLVEIRLRRPHGTCFCVSFRRIAPDRPPMLIGAAGPFTEKNGKDAFEKWVQGNAQSMARGEVVMIPDMELPTDVRRALEQFQGDSDG
jgi:hypothetical protein